MPEDEFPKFAETFAWIGDIDHTKTILDKFPLIWTFQPGPMPNDLIAVWLLRRKPQIFDVPYAFMVLSYGNDVFQVAVPAPSQDGMIAGKDVTLPPFPTPGNSDPARYGQNSVRLLDSPEQRLYAAKRYNTGSSTVGDVRTKSRRGRIIPLVSSRGPGVRVAALGLLQKAIGLASPATTVERPHV